MPRDEAFDAFAGEAGDAAARERAGARLAWIEEHVAGSRVLVFDEALGELLARTPDRAISHSPEGTFDSVVLTNMDELDLAIAALGDGSTLVVSAPFRDGSTPRILCDALRDRVTPRALSAVAGCISFAGERSAPNAEAWTNLASPNALLALTEECAFDALRFDAARLRASHDARRALITASLNRARSTEAALKLSFEQNVRLRDAVERTRRSARYQLGSAIMTAAKPSQETLKLPGRLLEIYRSKTKPKSGTPEDDETYEEAPRRRLLDERLDAFLARARGKPRVVVMFSGTRVAAIRGNRPYLLSRVLLARDTPVLFGYYGTLTGDELPPYEDPRFLELPVDYLLTRLDRIAAAPLGDAQKIFVVAYPISQIVPLLNRFNTRGWITIYDSLDDWEEFARASFATWYSTAAEKFVVNNCDFSACVSRPLVAKIASFTADREVLLSPNAYDPNFKSATYTRRPSQTIKIGYFGHLTPAWFDWKSLEAIARMRPNYLFELIGHSAPAELVLPSNMRLLGAKPPSEINPIAETWRAAIIPFKTGKLADAVDPIKVYEYLALGLPVVSFRMPQIADYPYTETVRSTEEFAAALDRAVATKVDEARVAEFLRENTWEKRVDALLEHAARIAKNPPAEKAFHSARSSA